jgi:hypothetical protein
VESTDVERGDDVLPGAVGSTTSGPMIADAHTAR